MEQRDRIDLNLSGVGTASGGMYHNVFVAGVGRVYGDIDCVLCQVEGIAHMIGNVKAKKLNISGKANIKGNVIAEDVKLEGATTIDGNCEAEKLHSVGTFTLNGLLNAGQIEIHLNGPASVKEMGGESIRVDKGHNFGLFGRFKKLTAQTIEGDDIHLEYTKAKVVRGNSVTIGPGCEIDLVEYRTDFIQAKNALVVENKKL